ncbi:MAG: phosphatase PAP2 family protein [Clostridia bacterium]|nr:phosphatase PAP2 family protein [Clostridia bacterium]
MFEYELNFLQMLEGMRTDFLNTLFETVTTLGEETLLVLFMTVIYFVFDKKLAQRVFFITVASLGVNGIIKNFAKIPRPWTTGEVTCVRPDTATGYSFPSGHTQNVASWTFAFAFKLKKHLITVLSCIATVAVAFSRIYLGAHYPSDVVVGAILGIGFAIVGNYIYDKVPNKNLLHGIVTLILTPFAIVFLFAGDPHYADFYKLYGLFAGFFLAVMFEEKYVALDCNQVAWKKCIRVVIGIIVAVAIKEGLKTFFSSLDISSVVSVSLIMDFMRYFAIALAELAICPLLFKKVNI